MGNNLNRVIMYLFLHAGTKFSKGRIFFFITLALIKPFKILCGIIMGNW